MRTGIADLPPAARWENSSLREGVEYPVSSVRIHYHRRDARIEFLGRKSLPEAPEPGCRDEMAAFSRASRKNLIWVGNNTTIDFDSLLTVTYPDDFPRDGRICKEHLRMLLQALRREQGMEAYLWVREFQARGAPHWHILTDVEHDNSQPMIRYRVPHTGKVASGEREKHDWVSERWQEVIKEYGNEKGRRAGCRWEVLQSARGGAAYLAAYGSKMNQKRVPDDFAKPGRWWGHSRNVAVPLRVPSVVVPVSEYLSRVAGKLLSEDGYFYATLHDGAKRAECFRSRASDG